VSGGASRRAELGQHFLAGGRLAAELVEQAGVGAGDLVVEIGAGSGVLTEALARRAGRVVAVEYDPRLAARARARLAGFGNVRVVTGDALALAAVPGGGQPALRVHRGDPAPAAGRSPDPAGAGRPDPPGAGGHAVRGQAARHPGDGRLGSLVRAEDRPPAGAVLLPPAAAGRAALLVARRRQPPLVPVAGHRRFTALAGAAFRHPGLALRRGLVPPLTYRQLRRLARELGFPLDARPADLDAAQWAGLFGFLERAHPGKWRCEPVG
jgi:23S rRNA (adenine-N6)-dimethyltransferase